MLLRTIAVLLLLLTAGSGPISPNTGQPASSSVDCTVSGPCSKS
jgi:hypothetical protein